VSRPPRQPWPLLAGASVQGRDHRAAGRENQDAFAARSCQDGAALVLAVSDGAGSQPRSALGSHIAVDAACRVLAAAMPGVDDPAGEWQSWLSAAGQTVIDEYLTVAAAASGNGDAGELAATLVAAVVCPPWAGFLSVGDSFATVLTAGPPERWQLILPPRPDPRGTDFLCAPWAKEMLRCVVLRDELLSGVVLATDGCAALALDHPAAVGLDPASGPVPSTAFFTGLAAAIRAGGGDAEPIHRLLTGEHAARCPDDLTVLFALAG
jgi:Protein phosphatase 2C